ncbi:MAG: ACP phosphodiesterase, partial [Psychromonas sp.]
GKWLQSYAQIENIQYGLQRMSLRSSRMAPLALTGEALIEHYDFLTELFFRVYPDVLESSNKFVGKV